MLEAAHANLVQSSTLKRRQPRRGGEPQYPIYRKHRTDATYTAVDGDSSENGLVELGVLHHLPYRNRVITRRLDELKMIVVPDVAYDFLVSNGWAYPRIKRNTDI